MVPVSSAFRPALRLGHLATFLAKQHAVVMRPSYWKGGASSSYFSTLPPTSAPLQPIPPTAMTEEMARGVQVGTALYINHGVGRQRLLEISKSSDLDLVIQWQRCMEAFLGVQVHVLAGLGYSPDEKGLSLYNQQLSIMMQDLAPDKQEEFRIQGRDTWRAVLSTAFDIPLDDLQELSIVDARNHMHKVSQRMQEPDVLGEIAKRCASIEPNDNPQIETAQKHHVVQEVFVRKVYLGGEPKSLVEELGFGSGTEGYVKMQITMADHQADPLVAQYVGSAMMQVLNAAGLDMAAMQRAAAEANK